MLDEVFFFPEQGQNIFHSFILDMDGVLIYSDGELNELILDNRDPEFFTFEEDRSFQYTSPLQIFGEEFILITTSGENDFDQYISRTSWFVLGSGVLLSFLILLIYFR